jgi:glucokinase
MTLKPVTLLVGDIGGTNARFALASGRSGELVVEHIRKGPASAHASFAAALADYRREVSTRIDGAVIGAAGPLRHGRIDITNGDWVIDGPETAAMLGGVPVLLANDFEAMARSAPELSGASLVSIGPGEADPDGDMAVAGPGTGLGVGALRRLRGAGEAPDWLVVGGEGGHQVFAPQTDLEWRLAERLRAQLGYVSNEVIASGSGLDETLPALAAVMGLPVPDWTPADLDRAALAGDELAVAMYRLRARTVMTALGDAALAIKATGGAFVAGGIGVRLGRWLGEPEALARFYQRGAQVDLMRPVPVWLIRDEAAPLVGAALLWLDWRRRGWR